MGKVYAETGQEEAYVTEELRSRSLLVEVAVSEDFLLCSPVLQRLL